MLPDFIIIGAACTGTSWLMKALHEHPDVDIPLRELDYFTSNRERGPDWYKSYFTGENKVKVEKSVSYFRAECAEQIKNTIPGVNLILVLRDPVERAYSQYKMHLAAGHLDSPVEDVLVPSSYMVQEGLYYQHLQQFLKYFSRKNLHVLFFDDFKKDNEMYFQKVCEILEIDQSFKPSILGSKYNPSRHPPQSGLATTIKNSLVNLLHKTKFGDSLISKAKSSGLEKIYYKLNKGGNFPSLPEKTEKRLADFYRDDVKKLEELLEKDLGHWAPLKYSKKN